MDAEGLHRRRNDGIEAGGKPRGPGWEGVPAVRRRIMQSNRRRDTASEKLVRSALHRLGLRFRVDLPIRVKGARPIRPDIVFPRARIALFVDGCFWHGCPEHGTLPATNRDYWLPKIDENRQRDQRNTSALEACGWKVVRVWAHEDPALVATRVARLVERQRKSDPTGKG